MRNKVEGEETKRALVIDGIEAQKVLHQSCIWERQVKNK